MLTTCPKCQHSFPLQQPGCCQTSASPPPAPPPIVVSATLHVPLTSATTCSVAITASTAPSSTHHLAPPLHTMKRVQSAGMSGGGIIYDTGAQAPAAPAAIMMFQKGVSTKTNGGKLTVTAACRSPEPSPSVPISFVLPTAAAATSSSRLVPLFLPNGWMYQTNPTAAIAAPQSETDLQRLSLTIKALRTCGWYYEGLSWQDSAAILMSTSPGTFLVRDSSDPRFLFSLSVQTDRGPTSVRLHYVNGNFRLDAEPKLAPVMPVFDCVVKLVEYYVNVTNGRKPSSSSSKCKEQVWVDCTGHTYSSILLTRPLYQKDRFPSLQHLARLAINKLSQNGHYVPTYSLPVTLNRYLNEYPYSQ